ncbi:MAG: cation:proton antiporter [Acidobacteriota bacterium]|nr:cation:proton antiporter [Acidobacteriota bacterium]
MTDPHIGEPALTLALAMAAGMAAQVLARHLRVPGIVLLLAAGVLLGPDLLNVVQPATLGDALHVLVGFAVAVILFEGGMNLNLRRLRREAKSIRQLVTIGAIVTAVGGALAARIALDWDWRRSVLFGTLVIVTGPTVITPLLRRLRLKRSISTVLEAEGVLIDAIGAILAVVTLEVVLQPLKPGLLAGAQDLLMRFAIGILLGLVGGAVIAFLLRFERLIPEGLENVLTLSLVLALFQLSNSLSSESGIVTVSIAGLVVGNSKTRLLEDLKEFKEQLTVLMIGMLFVLLAADVRVDEVRALGWPGVLTVAALMLIVRPLNVLASTYRTDLGAREKAFLAWMAPRGIVAAAVSSLFAQTLDEAGIQGGSELRALVFLVIASTVLIQGLSGGWLAQALGVRRPSNFGYVIVGANQLGLALGAVFRRSKQEVVFIDSSPDQSRAAEEAGFRVLFGSALSESILLRAELDGRAGALAVLSNDEVNLLFATRARQEFKVPDVWMALRSGHTAVAPAMVEKIGAKLLFAEPHNLDLWMVRLERGHGMVEVWTRRRAGDKTAIEEIGNPPDPDSVLLPLAVVRGSNVFPFDSDLAFRKKDELHVVINNDRRNEAEAWLHQMGWLPYVVEDNGGETAGALDQPVLER